MKREIRILSTLLERGAGDPDLETRTRARHIRDRLLEETRPRIAFASRRDGRARIYRIGMEGGKSEIFRVPAGGGTPARLTSNEFSEFQARLSPGSGRILYASHRHGNTHLFLLDPASGTAARRCL